MLHKQSQLAGPENVKKRQIDLEESGALNFKKCNVEREEINVSLIDVGQFFGEYEVIERTTHRVTKVTCTTSYGELIAINRSELNFPNAMNTKTLLILKESHLMRKEHILNQRKRNKVLIPLLPKKNPKIDFDNQEELTRDLRKPKDEILKDFHNMVRLNDDPGDSLARPGDKSNFKRAQHWMRVNFLTDQFSDLPLPDFEPLKPGAPKNFLEQNLQTWDNFFSKIKRANNLADLPSLEPSGDDFSILKDISMDGKSSSSGAEPNIPDDENLDNLEYSVDFNADAKSSFNYFVKGGEILRHKMRRANSGKILKIFEEGIISKGNHN